MLYSYRLEIGSRLVRVGTVEAVSDTDAAAQVDCLSVAYPGSSWLIYGPEPLGCDICGGDCGEGHELAF